MSEQKMRKGETQRVSVRTKRGLLGTARGEYDIFGRGPRIVRWRFDLDKTLRPFKTELVRRGTKELMRCHRKHKD